MLTKRPELRRLYLSFAVLLLVFCAANVWATVTHQPSNLHLSGVAAVICGAGALMMLYAGLGVR